MLAPLLLWTAAISAQPAADLVAAAAASSRPPECMPAGRAGRSRGATIWRTARVPSLSRYCHQLSRAHARIETAPESAREAAETADQLLPGRAAPKVLLARVALRGGHVDEALELFDAALALDPRSVEQPLAMHDLALAQLRSRKHQLALATYRVLVPRASLLPGRSRRAQVLLEAAHVAMVVASSGADDRERHLDEALAFLREAARDPHQALQLDVALSLVLALDRVGRQAQADAILSGQRTAASWRPSTSYLANDDDLLLLEGLAVEPTDRAQAAEHYRAYLASPSGSGPFASAASRRLARLAPGPSRRRRRGGR